MYKCSKSLSSEIFPRNFPRIISQFWKIPSSRELNKFGWHRRPRMQEEGERSGGTWWEEQKSIQNCFDTVVCSVQQVVIKQEESGWRRCLRITSLAFVVLLKISLLGVDDFRFRQLRIILSQSKNLCVQIKVKEIKDFLNHEFLESFIFLFQLSISKMYIFVST